MNGVMTSSDRVAVAAAIDGRVHGRGCYRDDGTLGCSWPEQHDSTFVLPPAARTVIVGRPTNSPIHGLVTALMLAAAVVVLGIGIAIHMGELHLQTVLSNSMRPTFSAGDVAVTQEVPISSLRVGDAISFYPPGQTTPVLHRITSLRTTPAGVVITTRGDANPVDDEWQATLRGATAYRLIVVVPFVGWLTELQRPAFLLAGVLLLLAILLELRKEVQKARAQKSVSTSSLNS
jgi:signal peptidase I